MGVQGIWDIVEPIAVECSLDDFVAEEQVRRIKGGTYQAGRPFVVGIDMSSTTLDRITHNLIPFSKFQAHSPTNGAHSQVFRLLAQLDRSSVMSIWVADGTERPPVKRGLAVIPDEPSFYKETRELVEAFGHHVHMAPGEAEAELAVMARNGLVDAIVTDDSDAIVLGAPCVMVIKGTDSRMMVKVYRFADVERKLRLTHGDLILYATLVGNDYDSGVERIGHELGLAVARCNYGSKLMSKFPHHNRNRHRSEDLDAHLSHVCHQICAELQFNYHGYLKKNQPSASKRLKADQQRLFSADSVAINAFILPLTSWSKSRPPSQDTWIPKLYELKDIIQKARSLVKWTSNERLMKKFHEKGLWAGLITRMLTLGYLRFHRASGNILAPSQQESARFSYGHSFHPSQHSIVVAHTRHNPLTTSTQRMHITFSTAKLFLGPAMLHLGLSVDAMDEFRQSIRVSIPSYLLAVSAVEHILSNFPLSATRAHEYIEISDDDDDATCSSDSDIEWGEVSYAVRAEGSASDSDIEWGEMTSSSGQ
ncbi:hypothetical protein VNI00_008466 [Paramarasmius palmivorus]|uniref:XPG-I domain-containing protein n=1 Tax=Paramarasmius palmivorus TaxID=297713 RepID=A0AAW0CWM6_9AGAR